MDSTLRKHSKIEGLDTLRAICALFVVLGHIDIGKLPIDARAADFLNGLWGATFCGPAAVVVFFLLSGFCIHFPQTRGQRPNWSAFFIRRFVRILPPMMAGFLFFEWVVPGFKLYDSIFWSLICELIYYTLYPLLFRLSKTVGWNGMFVMSFCTALIQNVLVPAAWGNYPDQGVFFTWHLGLPLWLLGCVLAEQMGRGNLEPTPDRTKIWAFRFTTLACIYLVVYLRFHARLVGYNWSLNFFGLWAYFWVREEIRYFSHHKPPALWEWMGAWSYSLYLYHLVGAFGAQRLMNAPPGIFKLLSALVCSYLAYRLFEAPSHLLARRWSSRFQKERPTAEVPSSRAA